MGLLACLPASACLPACLPCSLPFLPQHPAPDRPTDRPTVRPTARLRLYPCEYTFVFAAPLRAVPLSVASTRERTGLRHVCAAHNTFVCARVLDGGPGPARRSRPVPSRSVEYRAAPRRSPPAIHSSFSQPARPTDCQCPTARRTVCTQKRSGSPSLPPYRPPRSSALRRHPTTPFLLTHGRPSSSPSLSLRFHLSFSLALYTHTRARTSSPLFPSWNLLPLRL